MEHIDEVMQRVADTRWQHTRLNVGQMTTSATSSGTLDTLAKFKAETPLEIRQGPPVDLHIPAHETFTDDGADNDETASLSHDLVDAPGSSQDVVVWNDGTLVGTPKSVDYAADEITIDTNGNNETYDIYYLTGDQARTAIRIKAPRNVYNDAAERDAGLANLRDQGKDPITFEFANPFEGVVPQDYTVKVMLDAPYSTEYENATRDATANNLLLSLPVKEAASEIEGLPAIKRAMVGEGM